MLGHNHPLSDSRLTYCNTVNSNELDPSAPPIVTCGRISQVAADFGGHRYQQRFKTRVEERRPWSVAWPSLGAVSGRQNIATGGKFLGMLRVAIGRASVLFLPEKVMLSLPEGRAR
jgi:hypothetical protein